MRWFRLYSDIIDDPKLLRLSAEFRWFYVGMLCISSRQSVPGSLPSREEIAIHLRVSAAKAGRLVDALEAAGLIEYDNEAKGFRVHGWSDRQYVSDDVTARSRKSKELAKHKREERSRNVPGNTPEQSRAEQSRDREQSTPPKTASEPTPEERKLIGRAAERWGASNGDVVIADLLREYPADWVRAACDAAFDKHQSRLVVPYIRGVLRGYQAEGGPPKQTIGGNRRQEPPSTPIVFAKPPTWGLEKVS